MGFGETLWDAEDIGSRFTAIKSLKSLNFWEQTEMSRNKGLVAVAVSCDQSDLEDFPCFRENLQGKRAFLGFVKMATRALF
jgi:hypothetical protein